MNNLPFSLEESSPHVPNSCHAMFLFIIKKLEEQDKRIRNLELIEKQKQPINLAIAMLEEAMNDPNYETDGEEEEDEDEE